MIAHELHTKGQPVAITQLSNGRWRVQIRRKELKLDKVFDTKKEATQAEAEALGKVKPKETAKTLNDVWEMYQQGLEFNSKKPSTQQTERVRSGPLLRELGWLEMKQLTGSKAAISEYLAKRSKEKSPRTGKVPSGTSLRLELALFSTLCKFAEDIGISSGNPSRGIRKRPKTDVRRRRVGEDEIGQLDTWLNEKRGWQIHEHCRFMMLLFHVGCRPGELAAAKWKNVDLQDRTILFEDTKNGDWRKAHMVEQACGLAADQIRHNKNKTNGESEYLFSTKSKKTGEWKTFNYTQSVKTLKKYEVLKPDFHAHAMRREFVSKLIESEVPIMSIKKQTGHGTTAALEIYDQALATSQNLRNTLDKVAETQMEAAMRDNLKKLGLTRDQAELAMQMFKQNKNR